MGSSCAANNTMAATENSSSRGFIATENSQPKAGNYSGGLADAIADDPEKQSAFNRMICTFVPAGMGPFTLWTTFYCFCSISMIILNKLAVHGFKYPVWVSWGKMHSHLCLWE